jgi:hypothetical protein
MTHHWSDSAPLAHAGQAYTCCGCPRALHGMVEQSAQIELNATDGTYKGLSHVQVRSW